jgi:hypothetical protein
MSDELEEPGWRVRMGAGLLVHTPMSPERRALFDKEAEREAKALEFEGQARRDAALERRWELERQGVVPHSHADVLARLSYGADRTCCRSSKFPRVARSSSPGGGLRLAVV